MPQNESKEGCEYTYAKLGTVVCPRTFLFHFFQCCSEFLVLPTPPKVSSRCENTTKLQLTVLVYDSLIGMGENNAGDYHGDACLWRQYGRWWASWQISDMGTNSRKALSPGACRGAQHSHWPRPHWETEMEMGLLGWRGKQWSHPECPLLFFKMGWEILFCTALFCLFINLFIHFSSSQ